MNNYHVYDAIGRGRGSTVYKGRRKRSVEYVAIKSCGKEQRAQAMQEVRLLHSLDHPNVLRFHAWYETGNHLWIILEYCVGGDLAGLLRTDGRLPEASVVRLGLDLANALVHLHARGSLHCDLRPGNVLLDEGGHAKLGGFSLARKFDEVPAALQQLPVADRQKLQGPIPYLAPELLRTPGLHTSASDLWALGCLLYEAASGQRPFVGPTNGELARAIVSSQLHLPHGLSPELQHLLVRLLDKDPLSRCSWDELCCHPFWGASQPQLQPLPEQPALIQLQKVGSNGEAAEGAGAGSRRSRSSGSMGGDLSGMAAPGSSGGSGGSGGSYGSRSGDGASMAGSIDGELPDDLAVPTPVHPRSASRLQAGPVPPEIVAATAAKGAAAAAPQFAAFVQPSYSGAQPAAGAVAAGVGSAVAASTVDSSQPDPTSGGECASTPSLQQLVWHPTDGVMKPIVGNRRIERQPESTVDISLLPFRPLTAKEFGAAPEAARQQLLLLLTDLVSGPAPSADKANALHYCETLCSDASAVHAMLSSSFGLVLVEALDPPTEWSSQGAPLVQQRAAALLGLLMRHASSVSDQLASAGLLEALARGVAQRGDVVLQRRSAAALGELVFYVASQQRDIRAATASIWQPGQEVQQRLLALLQPGEDEIAQHYAAKTVENVCGQGGLWAERLAAPQTLLLLSQIVTAGSSGEALRGTAASALCRLLRTARQLLPSMLQTLGLEYVEQVLVDGNPRVQQAGATMLCQLLASDRTRRNPLLATAYTRPAMVDGLAMLLSANADTLRGKGLVALGLLVSRDPAALAAVTDSRVLPRMERLCQQGDSTGEEYLGLAAAALQREVAAAVPAAMAQLAAGPWVQQNDAADGGERPLAQQQFEVILQLLASPVLRSVAVSDALLSDLADLLTRAVSSSSAGPGAQPGFKDLLLAAIDSCCSHPELLLEHHTAVLESLLPALSAAVASPRQPSGTRFVCLKLLCDVVLRFVNEPELAAGGAVDVAVVQYALPLTPALFADEDPMPLYAIKMLAILLEVNPAWVHTLAELGIARRFFEWLSIDHPHNNVHNIRLCKLVVATGALPPEELVELQAVERAVEVMHYSMENSVDAFLEHALELYGTLVAAPLPPAELAKAAQAAPLLRELAAGPELAEAAQAHLDTLAQLGFG